LQHLRVLIVLSDSSGPSRFSKPLYKQRDAFCNLDFGSIAEDFLRPGDVREGDRHVTGLRRLAVNDRLSAEVFLQQFDQITQRDGLRLAQVEDLKAEFLLRAGND